MDSIVWGEEEFFDTDASSNLRRILRKMGEGDEIRITIDVSKMEKDDFVASVRKMKALKDESHKVVAIVKYRPEQKDWEMNAFQSGVQFEII